MWFCNLGLTNLRLWSIASGAQLSKINSLNHESTHQPCCALATFFFSALRLHVAGLVLVTRHCIDHLCVIFKIDLYLYHLLLTFTIWNKQQHGSSFISRRQTIHSYLPSIFSFFSEMAEAAASSFSSLPNEILEVVFAQIRLPELLQCHSRVCKRWNLVISSDSFWNRGSCFIATRLTTGIPERG